MPTYNNKSLESRTGGVEDPGAFDNRLSLDPNEANWAELIEDWEDGEEYQLNLTVRQISPGEFEVVGVTEEGEATDESPDDEEAERKPKVRKAVREMMSESM